MKLCIFEDSFYDRFYPLTRLRALFELRCGYTLLWEKIKRATGISDVTFLCRESLSAVLRKKYPFKVNDIASLRGDDVFLVNARVIATGNSLRVPTDESVGIKGGEVAYAYLRKDTMEKHLKEDWASFIASLPELMSKKEEVNIPMINYPWDLINANPGAIEDDFSKLGGGIIEGKVHSSSVIQGDKKLVRIHKGASVSPFVVLDVENGPIIIDENAKIFPFSYIQGPGVIGRDSQIMGGSKIREGSSIGPVCRVGGEVEESIIHAHSNKYHDGFLGHSYVCEWVNLGALTTNSDLKNDYSNVSVYIKGELFDSGDPKVGSFIGDHTKTSIGVYMNTGTVLGVMCNIVGGGGVIPKFIPSFCWLLKDIFSRGYGFKMQVKTAEVAMSRRNVKLTEEDIALLKHVHETTADERGTIIKKSRFK